MPVSIQKNVSLKELNTFGIDVSSKYFVEVETAEGVLAVLKLIEKEKYSPILILGGGSNILLLNDFEGIIIKNNIKGINVVEESKDFVHLKVGAGENWHEFVMFCVENNYGGIENLSLIPGTVGAAPMQNIGAYGVEAKEVIQKVEVIQRDTKEKFWIQNQDCEFGYRSSIFKTHSKNKYIITAVEFRLTKSNHHFHTSYGAIKDSLGTNKPTIANVSKVVVRIREGKLPNPKEIGNGGSFFKNPEISFTHFETLKQQFPNIIGYVISEEKIKVPAGWLIEQCGWKGKIVGNTGTHKNQALVLVNYGKASGEEIWNFARKVQVSVRDKFEIELEPEINIVS